MLKVIEIYSDLYIQTDLISTNEMHLMYLYFTIRIVSILSYCIDSLTNVINNSYFFKSKIKFNSIGWCFIAWLFKITRMILQQSNEIKSLLYKNLLMLIFQSTKTPIFKSPSKVSLNTCWLQNTEINSNCIYSSDRW